MTNLEEKKVTVSTPICVKVPISEYEILIKESKKLKKSVPVLLREAYFKKMPTTVLMTEDNVEKLKNEINRIGNNINQIARQLNSGVRLGWNSSLDAFSEQLRLLNKHLENNYGVH